MTFSQFDSLDRLFVDQYDRIGSSRPNGESTRLFGCQCIQIRSMAFDVYAQAARHHQVNLGRTERCLHTRLEMVLSLPRTILISLSLRILAVHKQSSKHSFATLLWDSLPHGGASQVHPHIHATVHSDHYYGQWPDEWGKVAWRLLSFRSIRIASFCFGTILSCFGTFEDVSIEELFSHDTRHSYGTESNSLVKWLDNSRAYCKLPLIVRTRWRSVRIVGSLSARCLQWDRLHGVESIWLTEFLFDVDWTWVSDCRR